jgi:hypothetical protein
VRHLPSRYTIRANQIVFGLGACAVP